MNSNKIGPNVSAGLPNTGNVAKAKALQQETDAKKIKEKEKGADRGDYSVNVSGKAKEIAESHIKALDIARGTPDVREDKIAELKAKIQNGDYQLNAENIADGMLREAIKDELSKGQPEL